MGVSDLPETLKQALDRIQQSSDEDLSGDDLLSRVITNVTKNIPAGHRIHGCALVLVTASPDGEVGVTTATDVWSTAGLNGLHEGLEKALERTSSARTLPTTTGDA